MKSNVYWHIFTFLVAEDLSMTAAILTSIGIHQPSYDDCYIIREVCKTISLRAAKLAAAGTNPSSTASFNENTLFCLPSRL